MEEVPTFDQLEPVLIPFSHDNIVVYNSSIDVDITAFNVIDKYTLSFYVMHGHSIINNFLFNPLIRYDDFIDHKQYKIILLLMAKFPKKDENDNITYIKQIMYYYFINLYTTIQKFPKSQTPFKVYRGTSKHYLIDDPDKTYYFKSFTSTSYDDIIASGFIVSEFMHAGVSPTIYIFYVHPSCNYINASLISTNKSEKEILFSPYHRYSFIKKEVNGGKVTCHYTLLPTDLIIPNSFETFIPWKDMHNAQNGGVKKLINTPVVSIPMRNLTPPMNDPTPLMHTLTPINNTINPTNDPNNNLTKFSERMSQKIESFGGRKLTDEEIRIKKQLISFFKI